MESAGWGVGGEVQAGVRVPRGGVLDCGVKGGAGTQAYCLGYVASRVACCLVKICTRSNRL